MTTTYASESLGSPLVLAGEPVAGSALAEAVKIGHLPTDEWNTEESPEVQLENLKKLLQAAIEVEHMTIPPYLMAMYTIKPGTNEAAYEVIRSVVLEEMLHMTLAANILTAIGGTPRTTYPTFMNYPACIPCRSPNMWVPLRHFSQEAIVTFLTIESPVVPPEFTPVPIESPVDTFEHFEEEEEDHSTRWIYEECPGEYVEGVKKWNSIAEFYKIVADRLKSLNDNKKDYGPRRLFGELTSKEGKCEWQCRQDRQVGPDDYYNGGGRVMKVGDLATAQKAIELIIEQGEGLPPNVYTKKMAAGEVDVSHYHRFAEIWYGRRYRVGDRLNKPPTGVKMPVDWDAVYKIKVPPRTAGDEGADSGASTADGSVSKATSAAIKNFNATYSTMLAKIELAFQGKQDEMREAIPLMLELKYCAEQIVRVPLAGHEGLHAHPTFEIDCEAFKGALPPNLR